MTFKKAMLTYVIPYAIVGGVSSLILAMTERSIKREEQQLKASREYIESMKKETGYLKRQAEEDFKIAENITAIKNIDGEIADLLEEIKNNPYWAINFVDPEGKVHKIHSSEEFDEAMSNKEWRLLFT